MGLLFENKPRNVIPNWRSFENTSRLGEINGLIKLDSSGTFKPDLTNVISDWSKEKNIGIAAELINAGTIFNLDSVEINEAIEYIRNNREQASAELLDSTNLLKKPTGLAALDIEVKSIDQFSNIHNLQFIHTEIHRIKRKLVENPRNSILWIDLARFYTMIGQTINAEKAILNGLYLSGSNRFILRSVVRFFTHTGDFEFAHDLLRKKEITKTDPWLIAAEISLALIRGRSSKFVKGGISMIESRNISPFDFSELSSSLGTIEMNNGNHKKSRNFFRLSLVDPNDNAIAQAEWAVKQDSFIQLNSHINANIKTSYEATAWEHYSKREWLSAVESGIQWFLDFPYSKRPILFATHVLRTFLKDHKKSIELSKIGLISHPNDFVLFNNITYSLCVENRLEEAEKYLSKTDLVMKNDREKIIFSATKGLFYFRKKQFELGRFFYQQALGEAKRMGDKLVFNLAYVNYTREEVIIDSVESKSLVSQLQDVIKGETDAAVLNAKVDIAELLKNR